MDMNGMLGHKGFYGTVEFSSTDKLLFGKILGISELISYEGDSIRSLRTDFVAAVDDYLAMCSEIGIEPERAYRGSFNVRVSPELHKRLIVFSASQGRTLNSTVAEAVERYIADC
jgi:predicted HicB family RNase H-like nuclease